jgi:hypothetical protein
VYTLSWLGTGSSQIKLFLKLYEEETIFISAFNAENFMRMF